MHVLRPGEHSKTNKATLSGLPITTKFEEIQELACVTQPSL